MTTAVNTATKPAEPGLDEVQETSIRLFNTEPARPLIPGDTIEWGGGRILRLLFTPLVQYGNDDGLPEYAMAESIHTTDSQVFTITIKRGEQSIEISLTD